MADLQSRSLKRKLSNPLSISRKRLKRGRRLGEAESSRQTEAGGDLTVNAELVNADALPWKTVQAQITGQIGSHNHGSILELEEIENVEVVYTNESGGRMVGFKVKDQKRDSNLPLAMVSEVTSKKLRGSAQIPIIIRAFNSHDLPAWQSFSLHAALLHTLDKRGFAQPTPIQQETLKIYMAGKVSNINSADQGGNEAENENEAVETKRRDIVGIAQTGSGKTLAYGLPILHHLLTSITCSKDSNFTKAVTITPPASCIRRPLQALILAPTRELALQVSEHLNACLEEVFFSQRTAIAEGKANQDIEGPKVKPTPAVSVAAIVGGMSAQKQRRILARGADVLVATPGRFWDLCGEDPELVSQLRFLRFLVLDEADRMIEAGHFQDLDNILRLTVRFPENIEDHTALQNPAVPSDVTTKELEVDSSKHQNNELQTFIFSATMSKELQKDLKRDRRRNFNRKGSSTLDDLLMRLDFRDPHPVVVDLSPKDGRVEMLQESKIDCLTKDKDYYLYYFLLRYSGRSLVFLGSIDGIRRLLPILELLKISVWPLHSGLQQKQRLKNLDRFKSTKNAVLLATDIAARGLDISEVDHVIHYQVPRSADMWVHRNGRTARAMRHGFGLVLCGPDERRVLKDVLQTLGRDDNDVPELNVDYDILGKLKNRVQLARNIDGLVHRKKKDIFDKTWLKETAKAMEVELSSDFESEDIDHAPRLADKHSIVQLANLKAELKDVLSQPLFARGVSAKYITSGSRNIVDEMLAGTNHEGMLGLPKMKAGNDVVRGKLRSVRLKKGILK